MAKSSIKSFWASGSKTANWCNSCIRQCSSSALGPEEASLANPGRFPSRDCSESEARGWPISGGFWGSFPIPTFRLALPCPGKRACGGEEAGLVGFDSLSDASASTERVSSFPGVGPVLGPGQDKVAHPPARPKTPRRKYSAKGRLISQFSIYAHINPEKGEESYPKSFLRTRDCWE